MPVRLLATVASCALATAAAAQETEPRSPGAEAAGADIVVTGQRAQQARSIEAKRLAIGVTDVAAADEIGRLPDRNVAEVIERLPGVGVTYDQGEGRYVSVRGVPSNLNGYTVNGFELGNPDGATRSLPLDIVSGQLLNWVEVAKVKTADFDGQGIGGTINLVTQTAFDFREPFALVLNAQAGYQDLKQNKVPIRGDASVARRFGADDQFGIVLGGSYSDRTYTSYGFYPDGWRPLAGFDRGGAPTNIKYTNYTLERERIGGTGSFDWRPSDTQQFYIRGLYSRFVEHEVRPRYQLDFATDALVATRAFTRNPDGLTGTVTGNGSSGAERRSELRLDDKIKSTISGQAGGKTVLGALTLDYAGAYVHNWISDYFPRWQFRGCFPTQVNFDFTRTIYTAAPATECSASQLQFRTYTLQDQRGKEDIWQGRLDATYRIEGIGEDSFLKVGGKYRASDRSFDQKLDTWNSGTAANRFTLAQFGLAGPTFSIRPDGSDPDRVYVNGPTVDPAAIKAFTAANLDSAYFVKDVATSLANDVTSDFGLREKVAAGYAEANLGFGALTVTAGIRYEHTALGITGYQLANRTTVVPVTSDRSYGNWLPSVIVRVRPSADTIFRAAYTRSVGRPEYNTLNPGGTLTYTQGTGGAATREGSLTYGNPALKPYISDNADAAAEWYFARGALLSVGVFAKFIRNPIFTQSYTQFNTVYDGQTYTTLSFSQPLNADKGDIIGIEAEYRQQLTFLPGLLSGFGISLTGTLTESSLTLPNGRNSTFPSQSRYLYGAELFYQKGLFEASVAYHNTGKSLLSAGDVGYNDQYNNDLRRLDAKASLALLDNVHVFFEAQNLTDEPTRQYQAGIGSWITQNERYGSTFYGGVSVKFR